MGHPHRGVGHKEGWGTRQEQARLSTSGIQIPRRPAMDNRQLVERLVECWNTGKLDAIDQVLSPKFIRHEPEVDGAATGREEYKQTIQRYRDNLANFHSEVPE